jgi:toxin YoeB
MKIVASSRAWGQYQHWVANDRNTLERLNALIEQSCRTPFKGMGKPEPLKGEWDGWWSRRINQADRLAYRVAGPGADQRLEIAQCRFHYS